MSIFFEFPINILSFFRLENDGSAESQLAYLEDSSTLENILQRLEQFEVCETPQHVYSTCTITLILSATSIYVILSCMCHQLKDIGNKN